MLEWLKRHVWKACGRLKRLLGSNPSLSARQKKKAEKVSLSSAFFFCALPGPRGERGRDVARTAAKSQERLGPRGNLPFGIYQLHCFFLRIVRLFTCGLLITIPFIQSALMTEACSVEDLVDCCEGDGAGAVDNG